MKKINKKIVIIFLIVISSVIVFAEPISTNIPDLQTKQYFNDLSLDALNYMKKYSHIPHDRTKANPEKYGHIVHKFWGWMQGTLNKNILPPQSLLTTNIVLIPEDDALEEDIAYFPYSISNKSFLVVQNSSWIMLFTECQAPLPSNNAHLKEYILDITTNLLSTNVVNKLAAINVKKFDTYYIAGTISTNDDLDNWVKYPVPVKIITDGKQMYISMKKRGLCGYAPAWQPLPYQWFKGSSYRKWEKKDMSHSITNVITNSVVK